jgi:beta-lactamase class A
MSEHRRSGGARARLVLERLLLAGGMICTAAPQAPAQEQHLRVLSEKLDSRLTEIAREVPGVMGIAVVDLTSGERIGVNEDLVFPQGSAIKIPVLLELYRQAESGALGLQDRVQVGRGNQVGGSGVLQSFGDGTSQLALRDLAVLMINLSDNTATNLLIDRVGMANVNRTMQELGLGSIRLQRLMIRPEDSARGNENLATAADAARLMALIARCELPITPEHCADLRAILEIPKGGPLPEPIPSGIRVAWKPGGITGVSTAWGIVGLEGRPYAIAAMVNYSDGAAAGEAIRDASEAAFAHFSKLAGATPYGTRVPPRLLPPPSSQRQRH